MLLKVDCLPKCCWEAAVHTLDLSWKKMDVKLMMMMMMMSYSGKQQTSSTSYPLQWHYTYQDKIDQSELHVNKNRLLLLSHKRGFFVH